MINKQLLYGVVFTSCLCQKYLLARSSLSPIGFLHKLATREYDPVRRTFCDVNYIYTP